MQNVAQGTVSDSDKNNSTRNSDINLGLGTPDKCKAYADLQDKFCLSSGDSESEEEDISEVESFILGEDDESGGVEQLLLCQDNPSNFINNQSLISNNAKFLLSGSHGAVGDYCIGDCGNVPIAQSLHHLHHNTQPQFDPDTQARLVALLEAAVSSSSDPEVLRRLTSSVSSALDEAAAALTRMRTDTAGGSTAIATTTGTVGGSSSNNSCSSSSGSNINSSGESVSSSRSSSTPGEAPRTLIEACSDGDIIAVKKFIGEGRSVHETTEDGESLLSLTCSAGYFDLAQVLLEHGASVEDHNENGHTPLMEAASAGHVDVAQLLLTRGAGINTSSSEFKESALTLACYKGHLEMVKFLLEAGADQEHKTDEMHTALMEASMDGHVEVARLLLDSGAQVNMPADSFESPLTLAACGGHTELALLLLERGANIEEVNDEGYTPLMEAAREGHDEMVKLLIAHAADINAQTEETQETALTLACCGGFKEVAHTLIKSGGDLELGSSTPLMEAAQEGHKELVKFLLDIGCNPNSQTSSFDTALTYAAENGHTDVTIYLVRAGANIEHESEGGRTPLMKACRAGHYCTVQFLANQGADVNKTTAENDHTPLSLACVGGALKISEYLLAIGADPHHKLKDNSTMIMEASKGGHASIVKLLMDYPSSIAPIKTTLANQAAEAAALQAESMGTVVENSSAMAVNRAQEFALGLSVMSSSDPQSSLGLNAANPMVMPDMLMSDIDVGGITSSLAQQQKNIRVAKTPRKNIATSSNYSAESLQNSIDVLQFNDGESDVLENRKGTQKFLEDLKKEVENVKNVHLSKEELDATKQQLLEQMQNIGKQATGIVGLTNSQDHNLSLLNSSLEGQVLYPQGSPLSSPISHNTVETQTSFLPTSAWTVLQPGIGIGDIASTLKATNQLSPSLYATSPLTFSSDGTGQVPSPNFIPGSHQEAVPSSSSVYLSPTSPPSSTSSFSATSPPNVPVQERRKMVPTKKQLDKKKLQLQQQKLAQQNVQSQFNSQVLQENLQEHPGVLQNLDNYNFNTAGYFPEPNQESDYTFAKVASQIADQNGLKEDYNYNNYVLTKRETVLVSPPNNLLSSSNLPECNQALDSDTGKPFANVSSHASEKEGTKKEKKRSISSPQPCNCGFQGGEHNCPLRQKKEDNSFSEESEINTTIGSLGTPLHLSPSGLGAAPGANLQFVPTSGMVSSQHLHFTPFQVGSGAVPLQYGHLQGAQQQQASNSITNTCSSSCNTGTTTGKSQVKQFLLQPPHSGTTATILPVSSSNLTQQIPQPHQQQGNILNKVATVGDVLNAAKKTKKNVQTIIKTVCKELQQQPAGAVAGLEQQTQQQISNSMAGLSLENMPQNIYPTSSSLGHYPITALPPTSGGCTAASYLQNIQVAEPGLMVVSPATPAKILNDQIPEMITTQNAQVSASQVGVPYHGSEVAGSGGASYSGTGNVCHYPVPALDVDSETDSNHDTALTLACAGGHEELVQLLLNRGSNIEHCDKKGFTPLILAATAGHAKVVEGLLNHSAGMEAQSERTKDTPLSLACSGGRYEVVDLLLQRGANKEHRNVSDYTPLSLAASGGYVNIIKLLLESGAEINSRTGSKLGISPLMLAAMNGHVQAVKMLLDMGSDINAQIETNRNTALTLACFQGRHDVVSLLVDRRANVEHRAKTGLTPLMEAASGGYVEVGKVLIEKGADVNAPPVPSSRDTALTIAADKGHLKFVELLIAHGALTEVKNKKGNSPMWLAAHGGHIEVVQALLNAKTDINSEDNRKVSCLMAAFKKGHLKLIKFMVRHVSQYPSDLELERFILTVNDDELKKRCKACADVINITKEKQAQEANKHANILLDLLEKEKSSKESKKASAQRKKQKKKARKQEKKNEERKRKEIDTKEDEEDDEEIKQIHKVETKRPTSGAQAISNRVEVNASEERDGDSGIDSNSQTSASSETKVVEEKDINTKGKKKKKKKDNISSKEKPSNNANNNSKQRKTIPPLIKSEVDNSHKLNSSTADRLNNFAITTKGKRKKEEDQKPMVGSITTDINLNMYGNMKSVGGKKNATQDLSSRVNALDTFGEYESLLPSLSGLSLTSASNHTGKTHGLGTSPKKLGRREDGWKEVSRKSKRVSVPNTAISRVIGRGGSNINTIREVSGAHIEVEKQGKSQGDRMIIIKGSTEATRQAQNLINSLVKDPDKDLTELIPKSITKVPPKIPKSSFVSDSMSSQSMAKSYRLGSAATTATTSMTATSIYSSAKSGVTTVSAWASIASPKRSAQLNNQIRTPLLSHTMSNPPPKSPAVRQLFPGEKKGLLGSSPSSVPKTASISDGSITFAAKLAENKNCSKNVPHLMSKSALSVICAEKVDPKSSDLDSKQASGTESKNEYCIFENYLTKGTHEPMFGSMTNAPLHKEKKPPLTFARAASEGLTKITLGQQQQQLNTSQYIEEKPIVHASRAPGYRGPTSSSATGGLSKSSNLSPIPSSNVTIIKSSINTICTSSIGTNSPSCLSDATIISSSLSALSSSGMNTLDPITPGELISSSSALSANQIPEITSTGTTSLARSAPGTPVASPSIRPIGHTQARQTSTPPPTARSVDLMNYNSLVGASRTPPPVMPSLMRIQVAPPTASHGTPLTSRTHVSPNSSFANGMFITPPPSSSSIASLAPGGPVSSQQRTQQERTETVNLAVGQPYRKTPMHEVPPPQQVPQQTLQQQVHQQQLHQQQIQQQQQSIHHHQQSQVHHQQQAPVHHQQQAPVHHQQQASVHHQVQPNVEVHNQVQQQLQQQVQQQAVAQHQQAAALQQQAAQLQQQQHYSQTAVNNINNIANLMGATYRLTAPQTNTTPVFTNSIIAPISATPHIQSNLNPNAPDFSSRAPGFVPGAYAARTQLTFQNGLGSVTPSIYSGLSQYTNTETNMQLPMSDVMNLLPRNIPSTNITLRSTQEGSTPSPKDSNPSSPTTGVTGGQISYPHTQMAVEDRHSKLQPIGTERAQKRSTLPPMGMVGVTNEMLWASRPEIIGNAHQVEQVIPPQNLYYAQTPDVDMSSYNAPIWNCQNWTSDSNH